MLRLLCSVMLVCWGVVAQAQDSYRISITVPAVETGDYKRPYGALWLAEANNQPIRVLKVWKQDDRWLSDLRFFWRKVLRAGVVIDGLTSATRGAGVRFVDWDGRGENGEALLPGAYKLCAELAREHGGRSAKCLKLDWPLQSLPLELHLKDGEFTHLILEASA